MSLCNKVSKTICKISWECGITKLINLQTVSNVYQNKNCVTITYNYTSSNGLLIFGSGYINQEPHTETIIFKNTEDATNKIDEIHKSMENLKQ